MIATVHAYYIKLHQEHTDVYIRIHFICSWPDLGGLRLEKCIFWNTPSGVFTTRLSPLPISTTFPEKFLDLALISGATGAV